MNKNVEEDIFDRVARKVKAHQDIVSRQFVVICASIAAYGVAVYFAFLAFQAYPSVSCEFVNNETLLWFWPPNSTILDAIKSSVYSPSDQCLFIAIRSLASIAMLPAFIFFFVKQMFASDRYHVQGMVVLPLIILFGHLAAAYVAPTEHYARYRLSFLSPIEVNIWKSMINIFGFYLCAFILAFRIPAYIRSTR